MSKSQGWAPTSPVRMTRRAWRVTALSVLIAIAVGTVAFRHLRPGHEPSSIPLRVLSPAIRALGWVDGHVTALFASSLGLLRAHGEVQRLSEENAELRRELHALRHAIRRVGRWPELTATAEGFTVPTVAVEILGRSSWAESPALIVDAGEVEGIAVGHPAVSPDGLAGRVAHVARHTALVRVVTGPEVRVAAMTATDLHAGLVGPPEEEEHRGLLEFIPEDQGVSLSVGEPVVTASLDSSFTPAGILIGTITETGPSGEGLLRALVEPAVDVHRLRDLLIVTGPIPRLRPLEGRLLMGTPESASPEVTAAAATDEITSSPVTGETTASPETVAGAARTVPTPASEIP